MLISSPEFETEVRELSDHPLLALLIALLLAIAISAAGFLWIEFTVPGIWPPWIGLPPETDH
jgi:hypothetical protein